MTELDTAGLIDQTLKSLRPLGLGPVMLVRPNTGTWTLPANSWQRFTFGDTNTQKKEKPMTLRQRLRRLLRPWSVLRAIEMELRACDDASRYYHGLYKTCQEREDRLTRKVKRAKGKRKGRDVKIWNAGVAFGRVDALKGD